MKFIFRLLLYFNYCAMANINDFFWEGYEIPSTQSKYSRIEKDKELRIRILSKPLIGWEYFQLQEDWKRKPVRSKLKFSVVEDPAINKFTWKPETPKEFWAFKVYNCTTKSIEIFQTTKNTIKESIMNLFMDQDFWEPQKYDLKITKKWELTETTYSVIPWPITPIAKEIKELESETFVDLEKLLTGMDPFTE